MDRRPIILLFAFLGVFAALGMSWHVHTSAILGPDAPNCTAEFYSLFGLCDDAEDDDAVSSDRPTPIEIQLRIVAFDTLNRRCFTYAAKDVPVVRGVMTQDCVFQLLNFVQGDRGVHVMQAPKLTIQSGVPFDQAWCMHRPVGRVIRPVGPMFKGNATLRADGRIHLHLDATYAGPKDMHRSIFDAPIAPEYLVVNANGSFALESGQTCFLGGLKRRNITAVSTQLALLSELPWVGSWFAANREIETDLEMMFLATVRIAK